MDRYDSSLIAIAIAKNMKCNDCPYKCRYASKTTRYVCETHWKNILDLVGYIPKRTEDGIPILPKEFSDD